MTYYWEDFWDEEKIVQGLKHRSCMLHAAPAQDVSAAFKDFYTSYIKREYLIYQHGSCIGYTTHAVIQSLLVKKIITKTNTSSFVLVANEVLDQ